MRTTGLGAPSVEQGKRPGWRCLAWVMRQHAPCKAGAGVVSCSPALPPNLCGAATCSSFYTCEYLQYIGGSQKPQWTMSADVFGRHNGGGWGAAAHPLMHRTGLPPPPTESRGLTGHSAEGEKAKLPASKELAGLFKRITGLLGSCHHKAQGSLLQQQEPSSWNRPRLKFEELSPGLTFQAVCLRKCCLGEALTWAFHHCAIATQPPFMIGVQARPCGPHGIRG